MTVLLTLVSEADSSGRNCTYTFAAAAAAAAAAEAWGAGAVGTRCATVSSHWGLNHPTLM